MSDQDSLAEAFSRLASCLAVGLFAACAEPRSPAPPTPPASADDLSAFEGTWEGDGDSGPVELTVAGDSLYFYARPDFQYDTTFTLPAGADPPELHATILDSPRTTDSEGERVVAIYAFEDGALKLTVVDKAEGEPADPDTAIARYRFERTPARD